MVNLIKKSLWWENSNNTFSDFSQKDILNNLDETNIAVWKEQMEERLRKIQSFPFQFHNKKDDLSFLSNDYFQTIIEKIQEKIKIIKENNNIYYLIWDDMLYVNDRLWITLWEIKSITTYSKKKLEWLDSYKEYLSRVDWSRLDDHDIFNLLHNIWNIIWVNDLTINNNLLINYWSDNEQIIIQRNNLEKILRFLYIITWYEWRIPLSMWENKTEIDTLSVSPKFVWYVCCDEDQSELRFILKKNKKV